MNEKPKIVWKKTPNPLLAWLILFAGTFLAIFLIGSITGNIHTWQEWRRALLFIMFVGATVATVVVGFWLFIRWVFCWRNFKRFLFGLACFVTLIALFYAEEDWRGKHDWEKFKRQWAAKGEKFDWQSVVPPPVPDDQNFAFSPVWIAEERYVFLNRPERAMAWYGDRIYGGAVSKILPLLPVSTSTVVGTNMWKFRQPPETSEIWACGKQLDLKSWQSYYRNLGTSNPAAEIIIAPQPQTPAQDVLLALSKFDPVIEQLRADSVRPDSRFPIQYDGMPAAILLPHLAAEKRYAQVLQLRAIAELQNGESDQAWNDVKLMMRLIDASQTEPFLISHLVRMAVLQITLQPIYEGLATHQWSDAQLTELDMKLAKLNFPADYESTVRGERALEIANIEFLRNPHGLSFKRPRFYFLAPFFPLMQILSNLSSDGGKNMPGFQTFALGLGPAGWLYQNELNLARFDASWYLPIADLETKTISPARARAAKLALRQEIQHRTPLNLFVTFFVPGWDNAAKKFAYAQASVDLARVAIALERYRLAHGEYPQSLEALVPEFIAQVPHDVIGGQPLHYRRTEDGLFVLYSVGWNETDDGGVVVMNKEYSTSVDISQGDWVWRYPAK